MQERYEDFKRWLQENNVTPEEYEKAIKEFCEKHGI